MGTLETDGDFGADGAIDADGMAGPGDFGASGGIPGLEAPGGAPLTEAGFGPTGAMDGGLGRGGATPAIEGGFGAPGGADSPTAGGAFGAKEGRPGGFGICGDADDCPCEGEVETDSGVLGFCTGFGGRLIIAVSRGFDASG